MALRGVGVLLLSTLHLVPLTAQRTREVHRDTRVRVSIADRGRLVGTLADLSSSALTLEDERGDLHQTPLDQITEFEVSIGKRPLDAKGALIGAGVGAAAGLGIGFLLDNEEAPLVAGAIGVTAGAMVGAGGWSSARGAGIGLLMGAVVGGAFGLAAYDEGRDISRADAGLLGAALLGGIGMYTGGLLGMFNRGEGWQAVPLDGLELTMRRQRGGRLGLGVQRAF